MASSPSLLPWRYRGGVFSRVMAALLGGYALASAVSAALAVHLPHWGWPRSEAVMAGTLLGFLAYGASVLACFKGRRALHAWAVTLLPALVLAAIALAPGWLGSRA